MIRVIGGGLSGLFAAYAFKKAGHDVELFEKSKRLGGVINTLHLPWGLVETAANGIINTSHVEQLCKDIDVPMVSMQKEYRRRYIFRDKPRRVPLAKLEALRLTTGLLRRPSPQASETLWDYSNRVFGVGATKYLIEPAATGVFGVDAMRLSANLVYDFFFKHRSPRPSGPRGSVAPVKGMNELVLGLERWLTKSGVAIYAGTPGQIDESKLNIITTDASSAAEIVEPYSDSLAKQLRHVQYQSLYSITLGYEQPGTLKGFGCLFPRGDGFHSLGVLFNSYIFAERGPHHTETWILPAQRLSEKEAYEAVLADREKLTGSGAGPQHRVVTHWARGLPIYDPALERLLNSMVQLPNIRLLGNYTGRMGLSKILDQAIEMAK